MGSLLRRTAWGLGALAWVLLAAHTLSARAIVERERLSFGALRNLSLPGFHVDSAGRRMHIVTRGNKGRHLILVHGLGGSTADWEERVMPALARQFQVTAVDLFGFGYSARDPGLDYDLPQWSAQIRAVMRARGMTRATLVGQSLGAAVVTHFAARSRRRVERLVLLSPLDPTHWSAPLPHAPLLQVPILGEAILSQLDHFTRDHAYSARHHARARHVASLAGTRTALLRCLREPPPAIGELPAFYAKIRAPTLVMRGELDTLVPARVAKAVHEDIRTAQLTLVPNAGHLLTRDQPDQVAETIAGFVKSKHATGGRRRGKKAKRRAPPP